MRNKRFIVAVATLLTLIVGTPVVFASDSSESDKTDWSRDSNFENGWDNFRFTETQKTTFEGERVAWQMKQEVIRKTFKSIKESIKDTFKTAHKIATTDQARNVAEVTFANALSVARQAYQDALKALGTPSRKLGLARETNTTATRNSKVAFKMEDMLAVVNQRRAAAGLGSVVECLALNQSAQAHSQDMYTRNFFSHTNPDGNAPTDRIRFTGYLNSTTSWSTGENIAKGYVDVASVMTGWMTSPGHRANILNSKFTHLGLGIYSLRTDSTYNGYIWTQNFGSGGTC